MATSETFSWSCDGQTFTGYAAWAGDGPRPAVLVHHAWAGQGDIERQWARDLAALGYVGVAVDVYGGGRRGTTPDECRALMMPLAGDRAALERRLHAGLAAARGLRVVDGAQVAAIGFCFGGLCALDLARSGADVRGVVAFHGLLHGRPQPSPAIRARVLALHGFDDPMATPDALVAFGREMTAAGADWQLHAYGGTVHAFTNPNAADPAGGMAYHPRSAARARVSMEAFLRECFAP